MSRVCARVHMCACAWVIERTTETSSQRRRLEMKMIRSRPSQPNCVSFSSRENRPTQTGHVTRLNLALWFSSHDCSDCSCRNIVGVQAVRNMNVMEEPNSQTSHAIDQLMAKCARQLFILLVRLFFSHFGPVKL